MATATAAALGSTLFSVGGTSVTVGTAVTVAGTAIAAGTAVMSARAQAEQAEYRAEVEASRQEMAARQAKEDIATREAEAEQQKRDRFRRLRSSIANTRASSAAAGATGQSRVQIEEALKEESRTQERIDLATDFEQARLLTEATYGESSARATRAAGRAKAQSLRTAGYLNAAGSLFSGATRLANRGSVPNQNTTPSGQRYDYSGGAGGGMGQPLPSGG